MNARGVSSMEERIAWHPAFYEAIQQELDEYKDLLEFHAEYPLTEEPLRIDALIIKKLRNVTIEKNIAAIFRTHNILEYKSPNDYVSEWDFHKTYAYVHFYAALNKAPLDELTLSFVETAYPKALTRYLTNVRQYNIEEKSDGIHVVTGAMIPIQIIESQKLPEASNLWLKNLSNELDIKSMEKIIQEQMKQGKESRLRAYIHVLVEANQRILREGINMMEPETREAIERVGWGAEWRAQGEKRGEKLGKKLGEEKRAVEIARELLAEGNPADKVARITKLPVNMVRKMDSGK
jgi:hypothetical protein